MCAKRILRHFYWMNTWGITLETDPIVYNDDMYRTKNAYKFILTEHGRFYTGEISNNCMCVKKDFHRNSD